MCWRTLFLSIWRTRVCSAVAETRRRYHNLLKPSFSYSTQQIVNENVIKVLKRSSHFLFLFFRVPEEREGLMGPQDHQGHGWDQHSAPGHSFSCWMLNFQKKNSKLWRESGSKMDPAVSPASRLGIVICVLFHTVFVPVEVYLAEQVGSCWLNRFLPTKLRTSSLVTESLVAIFPSCGGLQCFTVYKRQNIIINRLTSPSDFCS